MYNQFYQPQGYPQMPKKTEIIHVNGENGAMALQMLPNSQALLLDDTAPLVWLAQTDGAGYKTVPPYSIAPYKAKEAVSLESLEKRLERVERRLSDDKSDTSELDADESEDNA